MNTSYEHDDLLPHGDCGCGQCDGRDDFWLDDDEELYDDPYDVVMYDIDTGDDDLYTLIEMLGDSARSWYAKRRLNALAASGPLSALVADLIFDSLGRPWDPNLHPRDRFGRFIETGGFIRWLMKGEWIRGKVSRIDSDGSIHVDAMGNDHIPNGTAVKFKPELASKLISIEEPLADLSNLHIPSAHSVPGINEPNIDQPGPGIPDVIPDIPNFPEASETQKRIYDALKNGDMPAADLDVYRAPDDPDMPASDFANEIAELEDRGLVQIDRSTHPDGNNLVVRRVPVDGVDEKAVLDISDDQIDDIPDDETPDLPDSPVFTKAQRDLLDAIAAADKGEHDGVGVEELGDGDHHDDLAALADAGAINIDDSGRLFLENPEGGDNSADANAPEPDLTNEIFDASQILDDPDAQEAFQHYAEELARPGDENNAPLPEGLAPAKARNAEAQANKWWADRNGKTAPEPGMEEDAPEAEKPNLKEALNPRNQALADSLAEDFFSDIDDGYLDTDEGVEYRGALKRMFDAEDYDDAGQPDQARFEREAAERALRNIGIEDATIAGWPQVVRDYREGDNQDATPDVVPEADADPAEALRQAVHGEDVLPEPAVEEPNPEFAIPEGATDNTDVEILPDDLPEDLPVDDTGDVSLDPASREEEPSADQPTWQQYEDALTAEGPADEFYARLEQEARIAEGMDLNHFDEDAPWSWNIVAEQVGYRPAELLFNDSDGSVGKALNLDIDEYERRYEDELLQKFMGQDGSIGPDIMRLRKAGLVEDDLDNGWKLTDAGRERLGLGDGVDATPDSGVDLLNEQQDPLRQEAEAGVARAMNDAQDGKIGVDDAYDVAAEAVREGVLNQRDLDRIHDEVRATRENRGETWDQSRVIDHVGDDQRRAPDHAVGVREGDNPALDKMIADEQAIADAKDAAVPGVPAPKAASTHDRHQRIINQQPFNIDDFKHVTDDGQGVLDRNGQPVQIGRWYKANRGGGGDLNEIVGFYDQERYPGWLLGRSPDGKFKAVHVQGRGRDGGLNRVAPEAFGEEFGRWQAQRRANAGLDLDELDEFKAANKMFDGVPARVGMAVERRPVKNGRGGGKFPEGETGIVARVGMDNDGNITVFVMPEGAQNERDLVPVRINMLQQHADTVVPPTPTPAPDLSNPVLDTANLPDREWPVPSDAELLDRLGQFGGEADFVRFVNAYQNPGAVFNQVDDLVNRGALEKVAVDDGRGRPKIRVPGGGQGVPEVGLPDGANDEFEGVVLNALDGIGGDGGAARGDFIDIDSPDAADQLAGLRALVERGVVEEFTDDQGRPRFRRAPATSPGVANEAENELEAEILDALDNLGRDARGADLIDIDAPDAEDRMRALRALADRGVIRRAVDPETGKPVFRRPIPGDLEPVEMDDEEAAAALQRGVDPFMIANPNLQQALKAAGYDFVGNHSAGRSANNWAISPDAAPFPVKLPGEREPRQGHVYMVKQADPKIADSILNEVLSGAISQSLTEAIGKDTPGLLHHPKVGLAKAPTGNGKGAGGAVIMDHAAYGYPEGWEFFGGGALSSGKLQAGGASGSIIQLGLYDFLINNVVDRHGQNQMYARDPISGQYEAVVIDNGYGFGAPAAAAGQMYGAGNVTFRDYAAQYMPKDLFRRADRSDRAEVTKAVEEFVNAYQQLDVEAAMQSVRGVFPAMSPQQEAYARTWITEAKTRADQLALDIPGVVDIIMGL